MDEKVMETTTTTKAAAATTEETTTTTKAAAATTEETTTTTKATAATTETKVAQSGFSELLQCAAWVQQHLEAPKGQYNSFGKYRYRSLEDILKAVKPLLKKARLYLNISYTPIVIDGWHYVQATARLYYYPTGDFIEATAVAREDDDRKGMSAGQLSGATCSYAGKYALGALLGIDDAKDLDTEEFKKQRQG